MGLCCSTRPARTSLTLCYLCSLLSPSAALKVPSDGGVSGEQHDQGCGGPGLSLLLPGSQQITLKTLFAPVTLTPTAPAPPSSRLRHAETLAQLSTMTEGMEDVTAGPPPTPAPASPTSSTGEAGLVPKEKPQEMELVAEAGEEGSAGAAAGAPEGAASPDGEQPGGVVAVPGTCCVCVEMEQVNSCLHSEKICILPILACLLSLALCTAGLKWVFVDKIFQYEPPTHLDPKRMGQDPGLISAEPSLGLTVSLPYSSASSVSSSTIHPITRGWPEVLVEERSTSRPRVLQTGGATPSDRLPVASSSEAPSVSKQAPPLTTGESRLVPTVCK